ncbi:MAG: alpha/beta hydrolase [Sphingobium sp.]
MDDPGTDPPFDIPLPARMIGAPSTISAEARATLTMRPGRMNDVAPSPSDLDAWRRYVAVREAQHAELLAKAAEPFPCDIMSHRVGQAILFEVTPPSRDHALRNSAILYLHPGGYTFCGGVNTARIAMPVAAQLGVATFALDYRMPPDHPFPAALDDAVAAYRYLLTRLPANKVAIVGRSAGGGLAAGFLLKARDTGLPLPAACVLQTPQADLTESGDSFAINEGIDNFVGRLTNAIALYADGHNLRDPQLSPIFGDYTPGFPPTILTSGTRDLFLSNTVLLHRALRRGGVDAELHVWEAMGHGGFFGMAPEDEEVWIELRRFLRCHLLAE